MKRRNFLKWVIASAAIPAVAKAQVDRVPLEPVGERPDTIMVSSCSCEAAFIEPSDYGVYSAEQIANAGLSFRDFEPVSPTSDWYRIKLLYAG